MSGNGKPFEPTAEELQIYAHWQEKSGTQPRSVIVREKHLRRIRARLSDGYTAEELQRAADVACWDRFYLDHGYQKNAEIVFRNATRIDTLLLKWEREQERPIPL